MELEELTQLSVAGLVPPQHRQRVQKQPAGSIAFSPGACPGLVVPRLPADTRL